MKIQVNTNTLKRLIASGMMIVTMMSLSGCTKQNEDTNIISSSQTINADDFLNNQSSNDEKMDVSAEKSLKEELINKLNCETTITNSTQFMYENYNFIYQEELNDKQLELASYAYQKLIQSNIAEDVYLKELNNILVEQLNPRSLSDEKWQELFGSLLSTLNEQESVYDTYFILARLFHEAECQEQHHINEYDIYLCEALENEYNSKYQKIK